MPVDRWEYDIRHILPYLPLEARHNLFHSLQNVIDDLHNGRHRYHADDSPPVGLFEEYRDLVRESIRTMLRRELDPEKDPKPPPKT